MDTTLQTTPADAMLTYVDTHTVTPTGLFAWSNEVGGGKYQDYIGVPDGGMTLALLGLALGSLAFARRKA